MATKNALNQNMMPVIIKVSINVLKEHSINKNRNGLTSNFHDIIQNVSPLKPLSLLPPGGPFGAPSGPFDTPSGPTPSALAPRPSALAPRPSA